MNPEILFAQYAAQCPIEIPPETVDEELQKLVLEEKQRMQYTPNVAAIRYQAREEIAMKKMMDANGCKAFSNTFQDLYGMEQLPGLASQHLMALGYGYGGEGDWKVSAMTAIMKAMGENGNGASAFMEDYTYHLVPGHQYSLGAHMLEVCPSVADPAVKPRIETHFLGIGMNEKDPARLVFEGKPGCHCGIPCRYGRPPAADCPRHPCGQAHYAHAQSAGCPGYVAGRAESDHRRGMLDYCRRCSPHGAKLTMLPPSR